MSRSLKAIFISFCLALSSGITAQDKFIAGGRVGLGLASMPQLNESKGLVHFAFGGSANYSFFPFLGISADALFVTSGSAYKGSEKIVDPQGFENDEPYEGEIRFTTLSIPVYPQLALGNDDFRVLLNSGVATNFNLFAFESRDYENDNTNDNIKDQVKSILEDYKVVSFAVLYGAGARFKVAAEEYLQVDLRATLGLNDLYTTINNENPTTIRQNLYTVSVTYFF